MQQTVGLSSRFVTFVYARLLYSSGLYSYFLNPNKNNGGASGAISRGPSSVTTTTTITPPGGTQGAPLAGPIGFPFFFFRPIENSLTLLIVE